MQQRWGRVRLLASVWASNWRRKAHVSLGQGCSSEGLVNNALNNYKEVVSPSSCLWRGMFTCK